jgi:hypothetical protein
MPPERGRSVRDALGELVVGVLDGLAKVEGGELEIGAEKHAGL